MNQNQADTILAQLGGRKFRMMTGAKNFLFSKEDGYMSFKLPARFAKEGINYVKVTLTPADLYDVEFGKITKSKTGYNYKVIRQSEGVYADSLQSLFRSVTGLQTRLF